MLSARGSLALGKGQALEVGGLSSEVGSLR